MDAPNLHVMTPGRITNLLTGNTLYGLEGPGDNDRVMIQGAFCYDNSCYLCMNQSQFKVGVLNGFRLDSDRFNEQLFHLADYSSVTSVV